jgi:hypothetical protein
MMAAAMQNSGGSFGPIDTNREAGRRPSVKNPLLSDSSFAGYKSFP